MSVQQMTRLRVALGDYAHTMSLKQKQIASQSSSALKMIIDYCVQQKLIPRRFEVEELFDDTTRTLGA